MALIPSAQYPAQTDADAAYPQGKARNAGAFQDGTGTPLEKSWVNDLWGFLQSLLDVAGITPSGDPDEVGASQYLEAVTAVSADEGDKAAERVMLGNWESSGTVVNDNMKDLHWAAGLNLFIALAETGGRYTSPDGRTWTSRAGGSLDVAMTSNPATGLCIGAAGAGNTSRSTDGITWSAIASSTAEALLDGVWHIDKFVLVGENGAIVTSATGLAASYTTRTSTTAEDLQAVTSNGALAVAVGAAGTIVTSPDGITWTSRTSGVAVSLNAVEWSDALDLFVVVGASGTILTSPNGITWTARTSGVAVTLNGVEASTHFLMVVGASDTLLSSADGITWKAVSHGVTNFGSFRLAWSGLVMLSMRATNGHISRSLQRVQD
jgi:hypothetical protein